MRRSKADPFGIGRVAFSWCRTADHIKTWLAWRGPDISPLFCGIYEGKAIDRALEATLVKRLIEDAARTLHLDPETIDAVSGHSLRVRAAQDLLTHAPPLRAGLLCHKTE